MSIVSAGASGSKPPASLRKAQQLLRLFRGRDDHVAVAQGKGFAPEPLTEPLSPERLADEHLSGRRGLGFYLMAPDNTVLCSCADFDNKPDRPDPAWADKATAVHRRLLEADLSPLVEVSQSGSAAHVWLFFSEPAQAALVRAFWRGVLAQLTIGVPEIYPRQDALTGKGLGNLVRYPLWNLSHFVDPKTWEKIPPVRTMTAVVPVTAGRLRRAAKRMGVDLTAMRVQAPARTSKPDARATAGLSPRVKALLDSDERLSARWGGDADGLNDTSRSALVMSLACMLVRRYVPTPEIEAAVRFWCDQEGYAKGNREDWVKGVIDNAYDFVGEHLRYRRSGDVERPSGSTPELIRRATSRAIASRKARRTP